MLIIHSEFNYAISHQHIISEALHSLNHLLEKKKGTMERVKLWSNLTYIAKKKNLPVLYWYTSMVLL